MLPDGRWIVNPNFLIYRLGNIDIIGAGNLQNSYTINTLIMCTDICSLTDEKPESHVELVSRPSFPPSFITVVPNLTFRPKSGLWGSNVGSREGRCGEINNRKQI